MSADASHAFGKRSRAAALAPRAAPAPALGQVAISAQAEALAAQVAAERALVGAPDPELVEWKKAHRGRMWSAAGTWKYWAAILGLLSFAGHAHDFGPHTDTFALVLRGFASACGAMVFWRGLESRRG